MSRAPARAATLPATLTPLPPATSAAKDARLPRGVTLAERAPDALLVLGPKSTTLAAAVTEVPSAEAAAGFTRVFVHPEAAREGGMLAKLMPRKAVPLAIRASALLARGYTDIEAAEIDGLMWVSGSPQA